MRANALAAGSYFEDCNMARRRSTLLSSQSNSVSVTKHYLIPTGSMLSARSESLRNSGAGI